MKLYECFSGDSYTCNLHAWNFSLPAFTFEISSYLLSKIQMNRACQQGLHILQAEHGPVEGHTYQGVDHTHGLVPRSSGHCCYNHCCLNHIHLSPGGHYHSYLDLGRNDHQMHLPRLHHICLQTNKKFFSGYHDFLFPQKTNFYNKKFEFDLEHIFNITFKKKQKRFKRNKFPEELEYRSNANYQSRLASCATQRISEAAILGINYRRPEKETILYRHQRSIKHQWKKFK